MKHCMLLLPLFLCAAPVVVVACDGGGCPVDERAGVAVFGDELSSKSPKDYINLEKSPLPFVTVFQRVVEMMGAEDQAPALKIIVQLMQVGRKAFSKFLVQEALRQAEQIFAKHPELPSVDADRALLQDQLNACKNFFAVPAEEIQQVVEISSPV